MNSEDRVAGYVPYSAPAYKEGVKYHYACPMCGDSIHPDAYAYWDPEDHCFKIDELMDHEDYCSNCGLDIHGIFLIEELKTAMSCDMQYSNEEAMKVHMDILVKYFIPEDERETSDSEACKGIINAMQRLSEAGIEIPAEIAAQLVFEAL